MANFIADLVEAGLFLFVTLIVAESFIGSLPIAIVAAILVTFGAIWVAMQIDPNKFEL